MSMKHRRGNRETKKPKQDKTKKIVATTPFASHTNPGAKAAANKHK